MLNKEEREAKKLRQQIDSVRLLLKTKINGDTNIYNSITVKLTQIKTLIDTLQTDVAAIKKKINA